MGASAEQIIEDRNLRTEAKAKGYEDERCPECSNYTMAPTCVGLKCDTCGHTINGARR